MNKKLTIILITILSLLVILTTTVMIFLLKGQNLFSNFIISSDIFQEKIIDEKYENNFDVINIGSIASNIYINKSNTTKVVVYGEKDMTTISKEDNILNINSDKKKCVGFCINNKINKIEIFTPDLERINIKSNFGDIKIGEFENTSIDLKLNAGDIEINSVKNVKVHNEYGDIKIRNITSSLDINHEKGDTVLDNINIEKHSNIKNDFGDVKIGMTNNIYIDASTSLGEVKINNNFRKENIILKIKNSFGDIKVRN